MGSFRHSSCQAQLSMVDFLSWLPRASRLCPSALQVLQVTWFQAFALTQAIEILTGLMINKKESKGRLSLLIFTATSLTHPILWFVIHRLCLEYELSYLQFLILGESYVVLIESMLYWIFKIDRPIRFALILNASSFAFGLLIQKFVV